MVFLSLLFEVKSEYYTHEFSFTQDSIRHIAIDTVTVYGVSVIRRNSTYRYTPLESRYLVSVVGESDVLRYIATLPGVSSGMEGALGYFVRGGNSGNNRIELDGVPIYGSTHLFGLFSIFHPQIVEEVEFKNGGFSASNGNFLASITRINSISPNSNQYNGSIEMSPFLLGGSINGPLASNVKFVGAARVSLLRHEYKLLKKVMNLEDDFVPWVADVYLKMELPIIEGHQISLSGYYSNDYFKFVGEDVLEMNWGNRFVSMEWKWELSPSANFLTRLYRSHYFSGQRQQSFFENKKTGELRLLSQLDDISFSTKFMQRLKQFTLSGGVEWLNQSLNPRSEKLMASRDGFYESNENFKTDLFSGFGELRYDTGILSAAVGIRGYRFKNGNYIHSDYNIRATITAKVTSEFGVESSFDQMSQYYHVLEGLPVGWSLDLIVPATQRFSPQTSLQYFAGGYYTRNYWSLSSGVYLKQMSNLLRYLNPSVIFGGQNSAWDSDVVSGNGISYGWEARGEYMGKNWSGSLSYTLSKTTRNYEEINNGYAFPFRFDRRHIMNLSNRVLVTESESKSQYFSSSFSFTSGHQVTIPVAMYKGITPPFWELREHSYYVSPRKSENALYRQLLTKENGFTLPDYLRVDLGYTFQKRSQRYNRELTFGVYNLLNRQNPYLVFYENGRWQQLSVIPIMPSVKWLIEF